MNKEIQIKLEEIVALLNDPEETVMEKEIKEKLEKVMLLLDNPHALEIEIKAIKMKLEKIEALVNKTMADPDIDIEYHASDFTNDPHILVTYLEGEYNKPTRKIVLKNSTLRRTSSQEIANQVTFSIAEFKGEIDSVSMG